MNTRALEQFAAYMPQPVANHAMTQHLVFKDRLAHRRRTCRHEHKNVPARQRSIHDLQLVEPEVTVAKHLAVAVPQLLAPLERILLPPAKGQQPTQWPL